MATKFNPLIFLGLDFTGSGGTQFMKAPVATEASLPTAGNTDGDARVTLDTDYIWVWNDATSRWISTGVKQADAGTTPNSRGYDLVDTDVSTNRTERTLVLQPADGTNPGIISTAAQNIAGNKTFDNDVIITGDLTVNGTTTTINTTNLDVTDQNITINDNGNDASAEGAGLTVERTGTDGSIVYEDALASKWKAGALGSEIEIVNVSSAQTLTTKTIDADNNTISNIADAEITANGVTGVSIRLDNDQHLRARNAADSGDVNLIRANSSDEVEVGATGQATVLAGDTVAIREGSEGTAGRMLVSIDTNGTAEWRQGTSAGDLVEASASLLEGQTNTSVTGLTFANGTVRGAKIEYTVIIDATADLYEKGTLEIIQRGADWLISRDFTGDDSLIDFDINASGQVQYTSGTYAGFASGTMSFRAQTLSV